MDKLSLSLYNSPSMKLEEEYKDGSSQNKWLSFSFDSAWRAHAYMRAEEAK